MRIPLSNGFACCFLIGAVGMTLNAPTAVSQTDNARSRERDEQRWQEEYPLLYALQHPDSKSPHALKPLDADRETDPIRKLKAQRYNAALAMCDIWFEKAMLAVMHEQGGVADQWTSLSRDFLDAVNRLTESRLSLAETDEEQLRILEHQAGLLKEHEKQLQSRVSRGREGKFVSEEVLEVRYARLTAEIKLLDAKRQ
jgi:hypothetical protein